jgi:threonine aldolase
MNRIDLRSDTVTRPTQAMREAMASAEVGDDGYGDDPTVKRLEEFGAALVGKEASLFVPSGSFGNQLALFTHCPRGSEVILDDACHIVRHEAGAASVIAGVQLRCVKTENGALSPDDILARLRDTSDYHAPPTGLVCLENAHSNGKAIALDAMRKAYETCAENSIPVHLDGARIFNAAIALGTEARRIAAFSDSVMFCLSKGLCAPVGSLLSGSRGFIERAHRKRKIMGGQMRQAGVLAACGIVALKETLPLLGKDHETARSLAQALSGIPLVRVDQSALDINMVFFTLSEGSSPSETAPDPESVRARLESRGILVNPPDSGTWRLVTHHDIRPESVEEIAAAFKFALAGAAAR